MMYNETKILPGHVVESISKTVGTEDRKNLLKKTNESNKYINTYYFILFYNKK